MSKILELFDESGLEDFIDCELGGQNYELIHGLLDHTRKLEAMLEWACDTISDDHGEFYEGCHKCEKLAEARKLIE